MLLKTKLHDPYNVKYIFSLLQNYKFFTLVT